MLYDIFIKRFRVITREKILSPILCVKYGGSQRERYMLCRPKVTNLQRKRIVKLYCCVRFLSFSISTADEWISADLEVLLSGLPSVRILYTGITSVFQNGPTANCQNPGETVIS